MANVLRLFYTKRMADSPSDTVLVTQDTIRFELRFGVGQAPSSVYRDITSKSPEARLRGLDALSIILAQRFEKFVVFGPPPIEAHGWPK